MESTKNTNNMPGFLQNMSMNMGMHAPSSGHYMNMGMNMNSCTGTSYAKEYDAQQVCAKENKGAQICKSPNSMIPNYQCA